jgi:hypothetical protein
MQKIVNLKDQHNQGKAEQPPGQQEIQGPPQAQERGEEERGKYQNQDR